MGCEIKKNLNFNCLFLLINFFLLFVTTDVSSFSWPFFSRTTASDVGSLKGNFQVTTTGQAHYTIPIEAPPGTAGITPAISLTYIAQVVTSKTACLEWGSL
jgi:hypothetical protein